VGAGTGCSGLRIVVAVGIEAGKLLGGSGVVLGIDKTNVGDGETGSVCTNGSEVSGANGTTTVGKDCVGVGSSTVVGKRNGTVVTITVVGTDSVKSGDGLGGGIAKGVTVSNGATGARLNAIKPTQ